MKMINIYFTCICLFVICGYGVAQQITKSPDNPQISLHGSTIDLLWAYDANSQPLASIEWLYKGTNIVLTYIQNGDASAPGPDFKIPDRVDPVFTPTFNAGLRILSVDAANDEAVYTINVFLDRGNILIQDASTNVELIVYGSEADISPWANIDGTGSQDTDQWPLSAPVKVKPSFKVTVNASDIRRFDTNSASVQISIPGDNATCRGTQAEFKCEDLELDAGVSTGIVNLTLTFMYGTIKYERFTQLDIEDIQTTTEPTVTSTLDDNSNLVDNMTTSPPQMTTKPDTTNQPSSESGLKTWQIAVIAVTCVVAVIIMAIILYYYCCRKPTPPKNIPQEHVRGSTQGLQNPGYVNSMAGQSKHGGVRTVGQPYPDNQQLGQDKGYMGQKSMPNEHY